MVRAQPRGIMADETRSEVLEAIKAQGEIVRQLKAAKADPSNVSYNFRGVIQKFINNNGWKSGSDIWRCQPVTTWDLFELTFTRISYNTLLDISLVFFGDI